MTSVNKILILNHKKGELITSKQFKIQSIVSEKFKSIEEQHRDMFNFSQDIGKAHVLASISYALDNNLSERDIREIVDEYLSYVDKDVLEYYIELKTHLSKGKEI